MPLDLLRDAGVDMEKPEPVDTGRPKYFGMLVEELDACCDPLPMICQIYQRF